MSNRAGLRTFAAALVGILALLASALAGVAGAAEMTVSSVDLIERSNAYDGKEVVFKGEAVGDILHRGDNAWVAVNDDHYSRKPLRENEELKGGNSGIGIYGPSIEIDKIHLLGSYRTQGDIVEVRGTFYKSSARHGGDLCIVARSLRVLQEGHGLPRGGANAELVAAGALAVVCLVLAGLIAARRRERIGE